MDNEYINKADAVKTLMQMQWHNEDGYTVDDADEKRKYAEDWVNCMPTIDIVHCGECMRAKLNWADVDGKYYCNRHQDVFVKDYFCADGVRRTENE